MDKPLHIYIYQHFQTLSLEDLFIIFNGIEDKKMTFDTLKFILSGHTGDDKKWMVRTVIENEELKNDSYYLKYTGGYYKIKRGMNINHHEDVENFKEEL